MIAPLWGPIVAKALSTALVVVTASVLAEAFGPLWGALIACLPVSAGPAYVFLVLQQGEAFVAISALTSCAANAATGLYLVVYALLASRRSRWISLGIALAAWSAICLLILSLAWTPITATLLNLCVYSAGFLILRPVVAARIDPVAQRRGRWPELAARAIAVAMFVTAVVLGSSALGPDATGIAAVFPVTFTSLLIILQSRIGGQRTALLAANALQVMPGFGLMLLVIHLAVVPWGAVASMSAGLVASMVWSCGLLIVKGRFRFGRASG